MNDEQQNDEQQSDEQQDVFQQWLDAQNQIWQSFTQPLNVDNPHTDSPHIHKQWAEQMTKQSELFNELGQKILNATQSDNPTPDDLIKNVTEHFQKTTQTHSFNQWQIPEAMQDFLNNLDGDQAHLQFPFFMQAVSAKQQAYQDHIKQLTSHWQALQKAWSEFNSYQQQIQEQARTTFTDKLNNQPSQSLDELYQCWIDAYEAALNSQVQDPGYQSAYAALFNSALSLRTALSQLTADDYHQLSLVPLSDYQALLKQHHQLRKDQRRTQKSLSQLEARMAELEQQLKGRR